MPLPESIRRAWTETDYRVRVPYGGFASIRCGQPLPMPLLAMLRRADDPWGYITAWNPAGVALFVPGMTHAQLDAMARRFGQLSVVRGIGAGPAELHELM